MAWIALRAELTVEANTLSSAGVEFPPLYCVSEDALDHYRERVELGLWDAEYQRMKADRKRKRDAKAAARKPCPQCGGEVTRESKNGCAKLPKYCSTKCMRAAKWARWYEKNKDTVNAKRRKSANEYHGGSMNPHHCNARSSDLTCTLHKGHKGTHYDSTLDQSFVHSTTLGVAGGGSMRVRIPTIYEMGLYRLAADSARGMLESYRWRVRRMASDVRLTGRSPSTSKEPPPSVPRSWMDLGV